jgi:curved DNA-binding protein CbpA
MTDPYLILGVPPDSDDAGIQAAYLAAIKRCPPERDAQRFAEIRAAFEAIRTRKDRLSYALFDVNPPTVQDLLDRAVPVGQPGRPDEALFKALLRGAG